MSINLLLVSPYSQKFYGGVQNQLKLLAESLPKENYEVKFLCPDSNDFNLGKPLRIPFNGSIAPIKLLPKKSVISDALAWADVVHIHEPFIPIFFWRLNIDKKTIISHHASLSQFLSWCQKKLIKNVSNSYKVTAVSNEAAKHIPIDVTVDVVPNMIVANNKKFTRDDSFLFIGRNEKRKNLKLYKELSNLSHNSKYKFRAITNNSLKSNNISIYESPDETSKNNIINKSSIYIAPNTHGESFGITILEAINSGCIAVCSDITAFKELLADSGVYFKNNDINSLAATVENLLQADLEKVYFNQKNHIKKYLLEKVLPYWISLYTQI